MRKTTLCYALAVFLCLCTSAHADLLFKFDAESTDVVLGGESVTVTISAKAEGASAGNGLFGWGFDAFVDTDGVVEIVDGTVQYLAPSPWSPNPDTKWDSFNQVVTGGMGSIEYMRLQADLSLFMNSDTGADVYTPIAQFEIQATATAAVNDTVTYTLGGTNFGGILADGATVYSVDMNNVEFVSGQNVFTIVSVPEPSSLLILSGLGMIGYLRRKK